MHITNFLKTRFSTIIKELLVSKINILDVSFVIVNLLESTDYLLKSHLNLFLDLFVHLVFLFNLANQFIQLQFRYPL